MPDSIIVAIISSAVTLFGVVLSNSRTAAVTNTEIKHLTAEVQKHNNFAVRVPVLEEQIKEISHRLDELERK